MWWIFLFLVPVVNVLILIVVSVDIAAAFGKGVGFGLGLAFLCFLYFPILAFGEAEFDRLPSLPLGIVATRDHFKGLGVSIVWNFHGRGIRVRLARGSAILDEHVAELIPLGLNELYLSRTQIGDESLPQFAAMAQLQTLDVSTTNFSRDGIRQLKESLPDAKIFA